MGFSCCIRGHSYFFFFIFISPIQLSLAYYKCLVSLQPDSYASQGHIVHSIEAGPFPREFTPAFSLHL